MGIPNVSQNGKFKELSVKYGLRRMFIYLMGRKKTNFKGRFSVFYFIGLLGEVLKCANALWNKLKIERYESEIIKIKKMFPSNYFEGVD